MSDVDEQLPSQTLGAEVDTTVTFKNTPAGEDDERKPSVGSDLADDELESLRQQLQALKEAKERETARFRLQMEIQKAQLELDHQKYSQATELELQRMKGEQEMQASTPKFDRSGLSFGGISEVKPDESILMLKTIIEDQKTQQQYIVDNMHAPKIDLIKFDGNPLRYFPFVTAFDNAVASKIKDASTKLNALVQATTGEVSSLLQCCLVKPPEEGYQLARELLEERFGNKDVISQAWMSRVLERPRVKDVKSLRKFADDLRTCRETLIATDNLPEMETRASLKAIALKLSDQDYSRWLRVNFAIKDREKRSVKLKDLVDFVDRLARERSDPIFGTSDTQSRDKPIKPAAKRSTFTTDARASFTPEQVSQGRTQRKTTQSYRCPKCTSQHFLNQCSEFRAMSVKDRLEFVQKSELCINCFQHGHKGRDCTRSWVCNIDGCGQKHNRWVHLPRADPAPDMMLESGSAKPTQERPTQTNLTSASTAVDQGRVALPIVPVMVKSADGDFVKAYALHDNCSNGSLCTDQLVRKLGLPTEKTTATFTTVNQSNTEVKCNVVDLEVAPLNLEGSTYMMKRVLARPSLNVGANGLATKTDVLQHPHLKDLNIPDIDVDAVDILIGQDNADLLVPLETRVGGPKQPFAVRTILGWGLNGPMPGSVPRNYSSHFIDLEKQVEKFWRLDDPFVRDQPLSISEKKVLSMWEKSIEMDGNHYSLKIPFKQRPPCLPDNRHVAEQRLHLLGKRLIKNPELRDKYTKCINHSLKMGYVEPIPKEDHKRADGYVWYLPHHAVTHPRKDKLRVVFDCAARYKGTSLNDRVHKGPDLTNKLMGVLLRFRQEPIAVVADIEGMFNQIRVHQEDRDALRFLWWRGDDPNQETVTYRMATHLFGGIWSPSCASYALKRAAEDLSDRFDPETIQTVDKNFYVDDCLKSLPDAKQAISLVKELRELLALRGFRLAKFVSNSREVLRAIPDAEKAQSLVDLDLDKCLPKERTLGVLWNVEQDSFVLDLATPTMPLTKRGVLSALSSIFDPLGLVAPYVLQAKRIFQALCRMKLGWDEEIPEDLKVQWSRWRNDLTTVVSIRIPRCLKPLDAVQPIIAQLHLFSDASENGLGSVSYLRLADKRGKVSCALVMAKSRLSPLKTTTIPRLELAAAVISVRLEKMIREYLEMPLIESVFWTDSMVVLQYLRNEEKRFQTFVANRVAEIHSQSTPQQWRHVDSSSNPADEVSRGMSAEELCNSERWLNGPWFLTRDEEFWPQQPSQDELVLDATAEVKKEPRIYHVEQSVATTDCVAVLMEHYSSWNKLKRAVSWILRAMDLLHKSPNTAERGRNLQVWEMERAERAILAYVQKCAFSTKEKLQSLRKLCPVKEEGVLRVGGRLVNAPMCYAAKHPAVLPKKHPVTDLIVRHYHVLYGHSGVERILSEMRQRFWPVKGRSTVKRTLGKCIACRKRKAPMECQRMSNLPADRVSPGGAPFSKVGVDYFGPIMVKRGRTEYRRYGCVFTCLATRAVHIEVAHSLDTDSFIQALQRFIARRGIPSEIRSDNGSNFVGARKELSDALKEWNKEQIHNYLLQRHVVWIFNPPGASHMGGVWERQIRTIRSLILGLGGQQRLTDESLSSLMCLVESIVNGRPLTKLSDDPDDPRPLTPNHLLLLREGPTLPPGKFVQQDLYKRRWRQVQFLADMFWQRWTKEYLPCLQERQKWLQAKRNIQVGDLVLMGDTKAPRNQWPLALVTETFPGKDDLVRSVRVRSQTGIYVRPVSKLVLLEANLVS